MARIPRSLIVLPGYQVHKMWRGHNKEWNLEGHKEKAAYVRFKNVDLNHRLSSRWLIPHAMVIMSNHTHETYTVNQVRAFSDHMRRHHSNYGSYFNRKFNRCGSVGQGRPKTCLIGDNKHSMTATFYIHANPLRANLTNNAANYFWSTHRLYAFGVREEWMSNIQFPSWYMQLGDTVDKRRRAYRRLFDSYLVEHGLRKQYYLSAPFFGPISWVETIRPSSGSFIQSRPPPD